MHFCILGGICYLAHLCVFFVLHFVICDKCVLVIGYDSFNMLICIQCLFIFKQVK